MARRDSLAISLQHRELWLCIIRADGALVSILGKNRCCGL